MAETSEPKNPKTMRELFKRKPTTAPELHDVPTDIAESESAPSPEPAVEDPKVEEAVNDIMKADADTVLKAQDEAAKKATATRPSPMERFKNAWTAWWGSPRHRWGVIGGVIVVLAAVGAVPYTRYNVAGLVMSATATVKVVDSKTGAPVSGATVHFAGQTAETDVNGLATLHVHTGSKTLQVSKQYYRSSTARELVAFSGNQFKASLVALGHQVKVKVVNKITGQPVANAAVSVQGANTKTGTDGTVMVVIPSGATTQSATVSLSGYNTAQVTIFATGDQAKNTFSVVPAGKLYFLSNLSGKIDVVKANLDGSDRKVVVAGTGNEDRYSTSLLASRDWNYLALLSKRSADTPSITLIDATNGDKLTTIDQGDASFTLVGWSGDRFVYQVARNSVQLWQPNKYALKSFDATTGQTLLLDQTQASGASQNDYLGQSFGQVYIVGDQLVYSKGWNAGYSQWPQLPSKQAEVDTIGADGSGHKVVKTFTLAAGTQTSYLNLDTRLYEPGNLYIAFNDGTGAAFYEYEDGKVSSASDMTSDKFYSDSYPTYLFSPSGGQTFWAEPRDGKNTLFVGNQNADGQKQVASLSDYNAYGWFTDGYLLVSKNSSELYIMPTAGGTPFKITDYYKPSLTYNGYGGGYGGL